AWRTGTAVATMAESVGARTGWDCSLLQGGVRRIDTPSYPMHESAARRVGVFDQEGKFLCGGRYAGEAQRRRDVLTIAGVAAWDGHTVGERGARNRDRHDRLRRLGLLRASATGR